MHYVRFVLFIFYVAVPVGLRFVYAHIPLQAAVFFELIWILLLVGALLSSSGRSKRYALRFAGVFFPAMLVFIVEFLEFISYYLQGTTFNERFLFHVSVNTLKVGTRAYPWLALLPLVLTLLVGALDLYLSRKPSICRRSTWKMAFIAWGCTIGASIFLPNALKHFLLAYRNPIFLDLQANQQQLEAELQQYHVNVQAFSGHDFTVTSAPDAKNLLLIYLESVEAAYFDESRFPDLVPHLKQARAEGLDFTNLHEYPGTNWTMGGIFASQCGMPLAIRENDPMYLHQAINNVVCLGDILNKAGYEQIYMGGADVSFAGKGDFYASHGYQQVLGYQDLVQDRTYRTGWGLYDDTLFDLVAKQFHTLAAQDRKFNLTLLTLDTHHPNGAASQSCPIYPHSANTMLQAVHCTDFLFGKLLSTIQSSQRYKDTLIVVMSDHLAMSNVATPLYPEDRKLLAFALNAGRSGKIDMAGAHVDLVHTILDLLGMKTNAQFMFGQSLVQPERPGRLALFYEKKDELLRRFLEVVNRQGKQVNLCRQQGIQTDDPDRSTMIVGGQQIVMSSQGWPTLPTEQIFLIKSTLTGLVEDYQVMTSADAVDTIRSEPAALYFMLTQAAEIPFGLGPSGQTRGWRWYFGNPSSLHGVTGVVEEFEQIAIPQEQCQQILSRNRQSSPAVFALRQEIQRLSENQRRLQDVQTQYVDVYSRFYPSTIAVVSQSTPDAESYLSIDQAKLRATKGVTAAVIDPLKNRLTHFQSYNFTDDPETVNNLLDILKRVVKNEIVIVFTHEETDLPQPVIARLEELGARQAQFVRKGQPYLFWTKVGKSPLTEKVGAPGTGVGKTLNITEDQKDMEQIKALWNEHLLTIQSTSDRNGHAESFVKLDQQELIRGRRGLNVIVLDPVTKMIKAWGKYDPFANGAAFQELSSLLHRLERDDVLIVVAHDRVVGGQLPESLVAAFQDLGAIYSGDIRRRTPYIFMTKIGSDFRIEKFIAAEATIQVELTPQEVQTLFSSQREVKPPARLPVIAHAGGEFNGITYTNSLDALTANVEKGYILFEIDLSLTSDGIPVCLHDWEDSYTQAFGVSAPATLPSFQEFLQAKALHARYDVCTVWTLLEWLKANPLVKIVTDGKDDNIKILQFLKDHFPESGVRIIPQIYQPEEYQPVRGMGYEQIIWTLYQYSGSNDDVLEQVQPMALFAVTMPEKRAQSGLALELDKHSIPTYVHTINSLEDASMYFRLGIDGLYTDVLTDQVLDHIE